MISLLQLQYFRALAEEQHLTHTAEKLFISQTTLSTMISKLEKDLGVRLFDRSGGNLRLNECGRVYLQYVSGALLMLSDGASAARALGGQSDGKSLSLAISGANTWGGILVEFKKKHPEYQVTQQSEAMPALQDNLLNGRLDMALVGLDDLDSTNLEHVTLQKGRIFACLPHGHRLQVKKSITISDLEGEPIISTLNNFPFTKFCMSMFHKAGVKPNIAAECDYILRPRLLEEGAGIALMYGPTFTQPSTAKLYESFTCLPIMDDCALRRLALFWRAGRHLTPAMKDFLELLEEKYPPIEE